MIRAACFDLDGCLIDSRFAIATAMNHALTAIGLPTRPLEDLHRFIGPPLTTTFAHCLAEDGGDPALVDAAIVAYREVYPDLAVTSTPVFPGIPELLAELGEHVPMAVVTSKPHAYARPIVAALGLGGHFLDVFGPELDDIEEPKAVRLRRAMEAMGVGDEPRRVLMVGDRHLDVEAGRACGTRTVGVLWGIGDHAELVGAGADHLAATPADVLAVAQADEVVQPPM